MVDAVAGQDENRLVDAETAVQKRLRRRAHLHERLRVGDTAPLAGGPAFSQERAIGCSSGPLFQ